MVTLAFGWSGLLSAGLQHSRCQFLEEMRCLWGQRCLWVYSDHISKGQGGGWVDKVHAPLPNVRNGIQIPSTHIKHQVDLAPGL